MYISILFCFSIIACTQREPNLTRSGQDELKSLEIDRDLSSTEMVFNQAYYVPIYSDIYVDLQNQKTLLAATLSIRNSSSTDSLFISTIDYFNTEGHLVKKFIESPISLPEMATVNYVIEREDDTGGPGANFIVEINGRDPGLTPLVQAVMIGQTGNKAFSFVTNGFPVNK